jgi:putative membrane protein
MQAFVRRHHRAVTAACSVVSLALVIAAARRAIPDAVLPSAPAWLLAAIPHVNAVLSVTAIVVILLGLRAASERRFDAHRRRMLTAFGLFVAFLALYLWRVALRGPHDFPGAGVAELAYLAILAVHILLAIVCIPLLYHVLLLAITHSVEELPETSHARVARIAAPLWLVSFALGFVVYLLLYVVPASVYG